MHPSFEEIVNYRLGETDAASAGLIERHLESCLRCQAEAELTALMVEAMRDDARISVPERAHRRAVSFFQPWNATRQNQTQAVPAGALSGLKRLVAELVSDTRRQPGLSLPALSAGLRSAPALNNSFQMLYSLDGGRIEVDLQIRQTSADGHYSLLGQVVGAECQERRVLLLNRDASQIQLVESDETYTFRFTNLLRDVYILRFVCDTQEYEIGPFEI